MSIENPLWGAPRIHGELLKLGFEVAQSSVAKYMAKRGRPASQGWGTFLRNHAPDIAAMDLFVVPTIGFDRLYAFIIIRLVGGAREKRSPKCSICGEPGHGHALSFNVDPPSARPLQISPPRLWQGHFALHRF